MEEYIVTVYKDKTEWRNKEGQFHRTNGPAIEWREGGKEWFQNGVRHRVDGPACEYLNGSKSWWKDGLLHRTNGPAVENLRGYKEWYIEGIQYSEEGFNKKINPIVELTVDEISKRLGFTVKVIGNN